MVARTKHEFVNVFRPRRGSGTVARTRRGYAKVARLGCGSGMAPDPRLFGSGMVDICFFFLFSLLTNKMHNYHLFVCMLFTWI